jgi:hypothetical protein
VKACFQNRFSFALWLGPWQGQGSTKSIPPESRSKERKSKDFLSFFVITEIFLYLCPK